MSMIHANVPLVNKNICICFVKPICFATPKLYFAAPNGIGTHSFRSPGLNVAVRRGLSIQRSRVLFLAWCKVRFCKGR